MVKIVKKKLINSQPVFALWILFVDNTLIYLKVIWHTFQFSSNLLQTVDVSFYRTAHDDAVIPISILSLASVGFFNVNTILIEV